MVNPHKRQRITVTGKGVILSGDDEIDKILKGLPIGLQKKGARKAVRQVAKIVMQAARKYAPKKTGALRRSLTVRMAKRSRKKANMHDVGALAVTRGGMFKGDQYYGGFLEYGTAERWSKRRRKTDDDLANPRGFYRGAIPKDTFDYMRKALYENREHKRFMFQRILQEWLKTL